MNPLLAVALLQTGVQELQALYTWYKQRHGDAIPDWETIIGSNATLQAKIDAEKTK